MPDRYEYGYTYSLEIGAIGWDQYARPKWSPSVAQAKIYMDNDLRWRLPLFLITRRVVPIHRYVEETNV